MEPNQALSLLDQAVSQLNVNRDTHAQLQQAIFTLDELVNPVKEASDIEGSGDVRDNPADEQ